MSDNNLHRIFTLLLNDNRGVVSVGQVNYWNNTGAVAERLLGVDNKLNTLDITYWINKHVAKHTLFTNINDAINALNSGTQDETSSSWINARNLFIQNTTFIWGSLDAGGLFIYYNNSSFDLRFGAVSGKYTNNTLTRFYITREGSAYGKASESYESIKYIVPAYVYARGNENTNMDGGTYKDSIGLLFNRKVNYWEQKIWMYPLGAGATIGSFAYNPTTYNTCDSVKDVAWSASWQRKNPLSYDMLCMTGVSCDSLLTNGMDCLIFDDEHNLVDGWVQIQGHWYGDGSIAPDINDGGGTNPPQGGDGKWDKTNTPVKPTDVTQITNDALGSGFVTIYNPTSAELQQLAQFLFSGITKSIANMLKKLMANPMDYIVGLNMCHFNVSSTSATSVKFGGVDTGVVMNVIDSQFKKISGGSVTIAEQEGGMLDYAPNTKCKIFIPYCGIHELPIDLVMGGTLKLQYIVDVLTGSLVAELSLLRNRSWLMGSENAVDSSTGYNDGGLMWTYSGNCFIPIPVASTDYRNVVNGALGLVSGIGTSVATGNPLPLAGSMAGAIMNSKPTIQAGSNIGANYGYMTAQDAYIILEEPVPAKPPEYQSWIGYPVNQLMYISDCSGLVISDTSTWWTGTNKDMFGNITEDEMKELEQIMEGGICV